MLKAAWLIFFSELVLHWRRSQEWLYPVGFFIIVICFFPLAFNLDPELLQKIVPGCIWVAALLASLLGIGNIFFQDLEDGHVEQLLLCQMPFSWIISAKLFAQWMVTEIPLIILTPLFCMLFQLNSASIALLCLTLFLGTPILILVGTLGAALTLSLRQQGALLSVLILPLLTPVLIFGVTIVEQANAGLEIKGPCLFLAGLCLLAITVMPWVIAVILRISCDE